MVAFESIDTLFEEDPKKAYEELKKLHDNGESQNAEVLWRLAKVCHILAADMEGKNPKKKQTIMEGRDYAVAAFAIAPDSFIVVKWAAVLTGSSTDYLGTKDKIEQGGKFKDYLDKALAMDANEYSLLHMRGRYAYSVANLSWLERKAAATFFAAPPEATFDEAIRDFELANSLKPGWIENVMFLARCHLAKKENALAVPYLKEVTDLKAEDDSEREIQAEAKQLVAKYGK